MLAQRRFGVRASTTGLTPSALGESDFAEASSPARQETASERARDASGHYNSKATGFRQTSNERAVRLEAALAWSAMGTG